MAITLVQHAQNSTSGGAASSLTVTVSSTTSGNCLVVCISTGTSAATISSVKLGASAGNFAQAVSDTGLGSPNTFIWVDPNCAGSGTSVVVTPSVTDIILVDVYEFSGVATSSEVDKTSNSDGTGTSWTSGTTATTANAVEAWVGVGSGTSTGTTTLTGPSSPWTNETAQSVGVGKIGNIEEISGYQITSSTATATYSGTQTQSAAWSACVVTLNPAIVNTTTTGAMTLKPSLAGTSLGGNTTTSGGMTFKPSVLGTDIETFAATGAMTFKPSMSGTVRQGFPFPQVPQALKIELLINGAWVDVSAYVYQRTDIVIQRGKPNETTGITPAQMTLTFNNRFGQFTPANTSGAFYPFLGRNTQVRVSAQTDYIYYALAYRFWGEVSEWPPQWDETGKDVFTQVSASGWLRRLQQGASIGLPLYRYLTSLSGSSMPVGYWPCDDPAGSTVFASALAGGSAMTWTGTPALAADTTFLGTDAMPQLNGSAWTGSITGSLAESSPMTYTTPGTYTFTGPSGVTTLTSAECWGAGGGGGDGPDGGGGGAGEYAKETSVAVTPNSTYTVVVGAPGADGTSGGLSSFAGNSVTVTAHGGTGGSFQAGGSGGSGSANTTHHSGGSGFGDNSGNGGGGGSSGGTSAAGNNASSSSGAAAVTGGGPGGDGGVSGFCVDTATLIWTQRGWLTCDQVQPGDVTTGINASGELCGAIVELVRVHDAEVPVLELSGPLSAVVTPAHRWLVLRDGSYAWTVTASLLPDDLILARPENVRAGDLTITGTTSGRVWCPTTNTGTWLARRNGSVYFTGNKP